MWWCNGGGVVVVRPKTRGRERDGGNFSSANGLLHELDGFLKLEGDKKNLT
jgi:hypothetical protein